jgi:hypothetical protein
MEFNFSKGQVKSGAKSVDESYAQLSLTPTYNTFKLNNKAMGLLGIVPGDRVIMFDMVSLGATDQNDRYYLASAEGIEIDGVEQGAKVTTTRSFNYGGIYGTIIADDFEVTSISPVSLAEKGLLEQRVSTSDAGNVTTMNISLKVASCKLVAVNDGELCEVQGGEPRQLFQLTDFTFKSHTPRGGDDEDEGDEGFDEVED